MADHTPPIELQIITPEGARLKTRVDELTAPSVDGDFGVLPGHRPLIAALRTGIVTYRTGSQEEQVAVGPGFAQIGDDRAVLLTHSFCKAAEVDVSAARDELRDADTALLDYSGEPGSPEHGILIRRERWAATRLVLGGEPPPPTVNTVYEFETFAHAQYADSAEPAPDDSTS
jgi:F-type H+-transporting ATPase subunit epsilon